MFLPPISDQLISTAPASALARPALYAPANAPVGSRITARANGLQPGRYTLELVHIVAAPPTTAATGCSGRIGAATVAAGGMVTITGTLPTRLACRTGAGPVEGHVAAGPGNDLLEIGVVVPPGVFGQGSFARRTIHLTAV